MNSKISVIVPIYNTEKYLERCIRSIMNQTYKNIEIIAVNDGSTDNSLDILKKLKCEDDRIIIINQENMGVGLARNNGIDVSIGEFISFIDADDEIDKNFFSELIATQLVTNADIVESGAKVILGENDFIYPYEKEKKVNIFQNHDYVKNYLNFSLNVSVWGKIYRKDIIGSTRFPSLNINEDFVFLWEIVKKTPLFCENLNVNYHYYLNKEISLSKAPFNSNNMSMISHIDNVIEDVKNNYPDLNSVAKNHYNACLLHNLVLYYLYLKSDNCQDLYIKERDEMLYRARDMEPITSFLLLHEAQYDIPKLCDEIMSISNGKGRIKI